MKMTCWRNIPRELSIHALAEKQEIEIPTNTQIEINILYHFGAQGACSFCASLLEEMGLTSLEAKFDHVHFLDQHSQASQHVIRRWGVDAAIDRIEHHLLKVAR